MLETIRYKSTNLPWCPVIPKHWEVKKLKFITYIKARVGWHGLKADEFFFDGNGAYCITGTDFTNRIINWDSCYKVPFERFEEDPYIQLKENDLLITKDGTIGKVALVKNLIGKATLNSGVFVVRPEGDDYYNEYLYWILQSNFMTEFIKYTSRGSTIVHLYQDVFENMEIIFPPLQKQHLIAEYLDEKTTLIDDLISKKQLLIERLREERTAIINQAVTKGIDPNAEMKDSGVEWIGEIPKDWEVKKLKYLTKLREETIDVCDFKIAVENIESESGMLVLMDNERNYQSTLSRFNSGDILFNKLRPYLHKVYFAERDGGAFGELLVISSIGHILPKYLFYILFSKGFINVVNSSTQGTKMPRANWDGFINQLKLAYPKNKVDQQEIIEYIETNCRSIEENIGRFEKEIELFKEYKSALINEAVTGKKIIE